MPSRRGPAGCQGPRAPARTLTDGLCHSSMRAAPSAENESASAGDAAQLVFAPQPSLELHQLSQQLGAGVLEGNHRQRSFFAGVELSRREIKRDRSNEKDDTADASLQADVEIHQVGVELLQPPVQLGGLSSQLVHNGFAFGDAPIADVGFHDLVPVMVDRRNPLTGITCEVSDCEYTANSNRLRPGGQSRLAHGDLPRWAWALVLPGALYGILLAGGEQRMLQRIVQIAAIVLGLAGVVAVGFLINAQSAQKSQPVAVVGDEVITAQELEKALGQELASLQEQIHKLKKEKLEALIEEKL